MIHRCFVKGKYGSGLKNIFPMIMWWVYEFFWLLTNSFDIVQVCDFNVYLPALLAAKIKRKKIVYDIFDFYGDMIGAPNFLKNIIKKIDIFLIQFSDGVIVTDENRFKQIIGSKPKRLIAIYNTPPDFYKKFIKNIDNRKKDKNFIFGYIGLLEKGRGYDVLVKMATEIPNTSLILGVLVFPNRMIF